MTVKGRLFSLPVLLEWFCFGASGLSLSSDSSLGTMQMRDSTLWAASLDGAGQDHEPHDEGFLKYFQRKRNKIIFKNPQVAAYKKNKTKQQQNKPQNLTTKSAL